VEITREGDAIDVVIREGERVLPAAYMAGHGRDGSKRDDNADEARTKRLH
jgi:hypothetical protein